MEVLISRLMAPEVSTAIATGLGLTVCVFTDRVVGLGELAPDRLVRVQRILAHKTDILGR